MQWFLLAASAALAAIFSASALGMVTDSIRLHSAAPLPDGPDTSPPPGFVRFCMRWPAACINRSGATKLTLDEHSEGTIARVNAFVNRSIAYESSVDQYGITNIWTLDALGGHGNCEDYAAVKREVLRAQGVPDDALRIAIVETPKGEFHAVLTIDTDRGVMVLDNATPQIRSWPDTPYTWLKRQAADDPLRWVALDSGDR